MWTILKYVVDSPNPENKEVPEPVNESTEDVGFEQVLNTIKGEIQKNAENYVISLHYLDFPVVIHYGIEKLKETNIEGLDVTLHVGLGTFRPVSEENVLNHKMHSEYYIMDQDVADKLNKAKKENRRIISIGTTSTRVLETVMNKYGEFKECSGNTDIFIYPGYKFSAINALITNFHLPKSTLIMLISALANKDYILKAYEEAVKEKYRFFSFGDSMFIQ